MKSSELAELLLQNPDIELSIEKRRPYREEDPNGYLEGDRDFLNNNNEPLLKVLKIATGEL